MAKIPFIQKKGSVGGSSFTGGRHGTVERARIIPVNPGTNDQQNARNILSSVASEWRGLTDPVRAAWKSLADQMPGKLTGFQAYVEINATLVTYGLPKLEEPPAALPAFGILSCQGLIADDTPTVKLSQVTSTVAPDKFIIQATKAVGAGIQAFRGSYRNLSIVNGHAGPAADIDLTADYTAKFGAPKVGQRIGVRILPMKDGIKGIPLAYQAIVAAAGA